MSEPISEIFGVLFDLDGVVVDTNPWHRRSILEFCKRHRKEVGDVDEDTLRTSVFGFPNRAWIPTLFSTTLNNSEIEALGAEKEAIFREMIRGSITPLPGLCSFLQELAHVGVPIAMATSAPSENVALMLHETRLGQYFTVMLDDKSVTRGKPAPDVYLRAADAIHVPPASCIVFEDSLAGIESGTRAGCVVVGVSTTHTRDEIVQLADDVISDFRDVGVPRLLALLNAGTRRAWELIGLESDSDLRKSS